MRALLFAALFALGCQEQTLEAPSTLTSVRVLATRADRPYTPPGAAVNMEVLAVDGRANPSEPMRVYWLPAPCMNPPGDAYYGCFAEFGAAFRAGVDLSAELHAGDTFAFEMPSDAIDSHPSAQSQSPYGLAVVFTLACAGHVEYRPELARSPDAIPFACFDPAGRELDANDFVFAFSLVYAFSDRANANPLLESVTFGGTPIDPVAGVQLRHCESSSIDDCPATKLDVVVPGSSQEPDPSNLTADGAVLNESLYVQYYARAGKFSNDATTIFDAHAGRLENTGNDFRVPQQPGEYELFTVLHDNRGGATWQRLPLHVE
jgi:hypothetical protein